MKIDELIKELEQVEEEHGNLEVKKTSNRGIQDLDFELAALHSGNFRVNL